MAAAVRKRPTTEMRMVESTIHKNSRVDAIMFNKTCEYGIDSADFITSSRHRLQVANVHVRLFQISLMVFALTWYFFAIGPLCPFNNFDVLKQEEQSVGVCRLTLCAYISMARSGVKTILPCFEICAE